MPWYTHPQNAHALKDIPDVIVDRNIPPTAPKGDIIFPEWPFVEFSQEDDWLLKLGGAKRAEVAVVYHIPEVDLLKPITIIPDNGLFFNSRFGYPSLYYPWKFIY